MWRTLTGLMVVVPALAATGCSITRVTGVEERVLRTTPASRVAKTRHAAEVRLASPTSIGVRVVEQDVCELADVKDLANTEVSQLKFGPFMGRENWVVTGALIGGIMTVLGFVTDYSVVTGQPVFGAQATLNHSLFFHGVGVAWATPFAIETLSVSRRPLPDSTRTVVRREETCGERPAPGVLVRLTNQRTGGTLESKTDGGGVATIASPDDRAPVLQGWECHVGGCASPAHAVSVNGAIVGTTDALAGLDASKRLQAAAQAEVERQATLWRQVLARFRETLAPGDPTHCGMVLEVKPPIVKVQTVVGEKWFRAEQLYPAGKARCDFVNDQYVQP